MNKLRRILSVFAAFGILLSLTGCIRLAQEDGDLNDQDRFIGFFITYEYLDLFDHEKYFDDMLSSNKPENLWGKALQSEDYQGRLYAVLSTKTLTEEVTGTTFTTKEYVFEGLQGINFFSACVPEGPEGPGYRYASSGEGIADSKVHFNDSDDKESVILEGTLYVSSTAQDRYTYFFNPVYQKADGSVYLISGSGFYIDADQGEGARYTKTCEETISVIENKRKKEIHTSVTITVAAMYSPSEIVLLYMGKDGTLLRKEEYLPGKLPKEIVPPEETEYIIAETYKENAQGESIIERSLFDRKNNTLETFYKREDNLCVKHWTEIRWTLENKKA
jgi:hypothetical protein